MLVLPREQSFSALTTGFNQRAAQCWEAHFATTVLFRCSILLALAMYPSAEILVRAARESPSGRGHGTSKPRMRLTFYSRKSTAGHSRNYCYG